MRPRYTKENQPGQFDKAEANFTFEQKLQHIKAARQKKIEQMLAGGTQMTESEKNEVTLTQDEYDKFRDRENSLSASSIQGAHTWNYALEQAAIPLKSKSTLPRSPSEIYSDIKEFKRKFISTYGKEPEFRDFENASKKGQIAQQKAIKRHTSSRSLGELLIAMGILQQNQIKRHTLK